MEPEVHYCVHKNLPVAPILGQMHLFLFYRSLQKFDIVKTASLNNLRIYRSEICLWMQHVS